jgi:predicted metal-binding protein
MLSDYKNALLIHTDVKKQINDISPVLEQEIFFDGYYKAFGIGSGPCYLCKKCSEFCKYPHLARPAMEACGIDVFSTVRQHGFPIEVLTSKDNKGNYYGLVLIE